MTNKARCAGKLGLAAFEAEGELACAAGVMYLAPARAAGVIRHAWRSVDNAASA
jgi:hypothetical protein